MVLGGLQDTPVVRTRSNRLSCPKGALPPWESPGKDPQMKEDRIFFRVTNLQKQQLLIHAREENLTLTDYPPPYAGR